MGNKIANWLDHYTSLRRILEDLEKEIAHYLVLTSSVKDAPYTINDNLKKKNHKYEIELAERKYPEDFKAFLRVFGPSGVRMRINGYQVFSIEELEPFSERELIDSWGYETWDEFLEFHPHFKNAKLIGYTTSCILGLDISKEPMVIIDEFGEQGPFNEFISPVIRETINTFLDDTNCRKKTVVGPKLERYSKELITWTGFADDGSL